MRLPSTGFTYYLNYTIHINHRINFSQFDGAEYSVSSWEPGQDLEQESLIKTEDWAEDPNFWKPKEVNDLASHQRRSIMVFFTKWLIGNMPNFLYMIMMSNVYILMNTLTHYKKGF